VTGSESYGGTIRNSKDGTRRHEGGINEDKSALIKAHAAAAALMAPEATRVSKTSAAPAPEP